MIKTPVARSFPFRKLIWALLIAIVATGCARSPEQRKIKYLNAGKELAKKNDYARAILQFRNALQAQPRDHEVYYHLALAYLGAGDARAAVLSFKKALEISPNYVPAQLKLAELLASTRDIELLQDAEKRLQAMLAVSPVNEEALQVLAVTEWGLGKRQDAEQHLKQVLAVSPQNTQAALNLVKARILNNDWRGAEELLRRFATENPKSQQPVLALGELYLLNSRTVDAEQQFRRVLGIDPKNGVALLDLAGLQFKAGRVDEAERTYTQLSALPDPQFKPLHAIFLFQSGKKELALKEFEKLAKENPADRAARSRLIQAYYNTNRRADAERELLSALRKNPKDIDALLQRSRLYVDTGKYTDAQNDLNQVLRLKPDSPEAHYVLSKIYEKTGLLLQQRKELNVAIGLAPDFLLGRLELSRLLFRAGLPKSALETLDAAPRFQAQTLPVITERNWAYLALGDRAEARQGVDRALAIERALDPLLQDATLKLVNGQPSVARDSINEALKTHPEDVRAIRLLSQSYFDQKQPMVAVQKVREHVDLHANSAPLQYFLGQLLTSVKDFSGARKAFLAAKAANPRYTPADFALVQLDISEGHVEEARARVLGVLSSTPEDTSARVVLAGIEEKRGNSAGAIDQLRKVLNRDEANVIALNDLAYLLAEHGNQTDEALKFAQKAKEIAPENPSIADTLGWVLYQKGLYDVALKHLQYAVSKDPTARNKYHLAAVYFKLGDRKRGQQSLDEALKVEPSLRSEAIIGEQPSAR